MAKRVVIIASGPTELNSLPHLLGHLDREGIVPDIRIPPRNQQLNTDIVCKIIYAALWESPEWPPDKYVILVDTDWKSPEDAIKPVREGLERTRVFEFVDVIKYAYAQWHLEAWYFADGRNLRGYLRRDLGNVDSSQPDMIQNPKLHLRQLLGDLMYTSKISEDIASRLDPETIAQRSPSFSNFLQAVRNGGTDTEVS